MRLIDADKLLEGIAELKQSPWYENFSGRFFRKEAVEIVEDLCIKKAPTVDAVEVVRCENCKHDNDCEIQYAAQAGSKFFCAYGERRDESEAELAPDCPFCVRYGTNECLKNECKHLQSYKESEVEE